MSAINVWPENVGNGISRDAYLNAQFFVSFNLTRNQESGVSYYNQVSDTNSLRLRCEFSAPTPALTLLCFGTYLNRIQITRVGDVLLDY